ncbi:hypothetical protein LWI28_003937 [Acer negundo]|uniref:RNase H type-1 domain-containing protein n=1 Tax=Acer negundo TaxID=4023 RepID=A0AAD5NMY0_ACENE|nr:hypothetical protein LWI28_003937 [Acer negundo]
MNRGIGIVMKGRRREEGDDRWKLPVHGMLKVNCDMRVNKRRMRIGYGIIVRDYEGRVLWCSAQGCEANYDLDCAKALAIYKGLLVGSNMGLANYVVETDSETVVKQIRNGGNSEALSITNMVVLERCSRTSKVINFGICVLLWLFR